MKSIHSIHFTTVKILVGAAVAVWQPTFALAGIPAADAQTQAGALLSPPIVQSVVVSEPHRLAEPKRHLAAADDAQRHAQRLMRISNGDGERDSPAPPVHVDLVATSESPVGDAQEAARQMILGRDQHAARPATTARRPRIATTAHVAGR